MRLQKYRMQLDTLTPSFLFMHILIEDVIALTKSEKQKTTLVSSITKERKECYTIRTMDRSKLR
jgi:hypothetical protein